MSFNYCTPFGDGRRYKESVKRPDNQNSSGHLNVCIYKGKRKHKHEGMVVQWLFTWENTSEIIEIPCLGVNREDSFLFHQHVFQTLPERFETTDGVFLNLALGPGAIWSPLIKSHNISCLGYTSVYSMLI